MNANRIRFGTHARVLRANGWRSIVWVKGKIPGAGWPQYGLVEPTDPLIEAWRIEYADCGIGLVAKPRSKVAPSSFTTICTLWST